MWDRFLRFGVDLLGLVVRAEIDEVGFEVRQQLPDDNQHDRPTAPPVDVDRAHLRVRR